MNTGLVLRGPHGLICSLREVRGRPVIVAFEPRLTELDELRAELRALGAALIAIAPEGIELHQPDTRVVALHPADDELGTFEKICACFGVDREPDRLTLLVFDDEGDIRFRHVAPADDLTGSLRRAAALAPTVRGVNRRAMLVSMLVGAAGLALASRASAWNRKGAAELPSVVPPAPSPTVSVTLNVNGTPRTLDLEPRVTLLDALREHLGLTGTKRGCDHGQCGACTVLVGDRRIDSCLTLAIMHQDEKITTIEGLARGNDLHPMQAAFLTKDAFQCGYCTPGQILSAVGLVKEGRARSDDEIREGMCGNICRCGAYPNIVAAVAGVVRGS